MLAVHQDGEELRDPSGHPETPLRGQTQDLEADIGYERKEGCMQIILIKIFVWYTLSDGCVETLDIFL